MHGRSRFFFVSVKALSICACTCKTGCRLENTEPLDRICMLRHGVLKHAHFPLPAAYRHLLTQKQYSTYPYTIFCRKTVQFRRKFLSKKVKFALEQAKKAQRGSKVIALLFFYHRREWSRPRSGRFTLEKRNLFP
jgi:hypothetical protein